MSARASYRTGDYAGNDRLGTRTGRADGYDAESRRESADRRTDDENQSVARILSSLDRLGARIRALQPADEAPAERPAQPTSARAAAESLQRAIAQINRKRENAERSLRSAAPAGGNEASMRDELADLGARVRALSQSDRRGSAAERPAPAAAYDDDRGLFEIRNELRDLRDQLDDLRAGAPGEHLADAAIEIDDRLSRLRDNVDNPRVLASLGDKLEDIRHLIGAVPTEAQFQALSERLDGFAARLPDKTADRRALDDLARGVGDLAASVSRLDRRDLAEDLGRRLVDVAERITAIEDRLGGIDSWRASSDRQSTLMSQLAQRVEQMPRIAHELERQSASVERLAASAEALPSLIADLEKIRSSLDGRDKPWDRLVQHIDTLTEQIESGRNAAMVSDGTLERRITDLADHVEELKDGLDARAISALDDHFNRLTSAFEDRIRTLSATAGSPEALIDALGRIESHLADTAPIDRLAALESQVAALAKSFDKLDFTAAGDITAADKLITVLREEVAALGEKTGNRFDAELRALADKIAKSATPAVPAEALVRIEERLGDIAHRLEARPAEMTALAEALERLEASVRETLKPEAVAARSPAIPAAGASLAAEIAALREDISANSRRDRELLMTIGEAVEKIAQRAFELPQAELRRQEGTAAAPAERNRPESDAAAEADAPPAPRRRPPAGPGSQAWRDIEKAFTTNFPRDTAAPAPEPAKPAEGEKRAPAAEDDAVDPRLRLFASKARAKIAAETTAKAERKEPDFDVNQPLEPGSGKPSPRPAALNEPSAPRGATAAASTEMPSAVPSKADFIAAARRAAMAAGAEEANPLAAERNKSHLHLSMTPLSRRRHQLLMAGVALLVMIGTVNIGAKLWHQFSPFHDRSAVATMSDVAVPKGTDAPAASKPAAPVAPVASTPDNRIAADPASAAAGFTDQPISLAPDRFAKPASAPATAPVVQPAPAPVAPPETAPDASATSPQAEAMPAAATGDADPAALPPSTVGPLALRQAAASGDRIAAFEVASRLAEGRDGAPTDLAAAVNWFKRAAEAGLAPAQYRLGSLYEKGQGTTRDLKAAADWYGKAADQGNAKAMHNLAVINAEGGLGDPNYQMAAKLFQNAADLGIRDSQFNLGILYARGLGVKRDLATSYKWFAIAANAGDSESAKKRDDVAQVLSKDDLARARLAVETWTAKPLDPQANDVVIDNPAWTAAPDHTASIDESRLIAKTQAFLASHGFDPGPADGRFGKRTHDAIVAYQRSKGLVESGEIDGALIKAMTSEPI